MLGSSSESIIYQDIVPYLSPTVRSLIMETNHVWSELEEIRLRRGKPILLRTGDREITITPRGQLEDNLARGYVVTPEDIHRTIASISDNSLYAFEEEIRRGYITISGGHRVGLAGQVVMRQGEVKTVKAFSSIAIRVARQIKGCAGHLLPHLYTRSGVPMNTLLVSPPRCGKTTILRDIARSLSEGNKWGKGCNITVVDERSELGGCYQGQVQLDLGPRADVLDACPKAYGMMMALRSLSPVVIITDEIGRVQDVEAIYECVNAGVSVVSSIHAGSLEEVQHRPVIKNLMAEDVFYNIIFLSRRKGPGTVEEIVRCER
ncbi:MAG: stage III sporulation protein AA [Bacillota bacterium]|nr:stage III sporulation protein AA [Bacillota bacterium]